MPKETQFSAAPEIAETGRIYTCEIEYHMMDMTLTDPFLGSLIPHPILQVSQACSFTLLFIGADHAV